MFSFGFLAGTGPGRLREWQRGGGMQMLCLEALFCCCSLSFPAFSFCSGKQALWTAAMFQCPFCPSQSVLVKLCCHRGSAPTTYFLSTDNHCWWEWGWAWWYYDQAGPQTQNDVRVLHCFWNRSEKGQKQVRNRSEIGQKQVRNRSEIEQKQVRNKSEIGQKQVRNKSETGQK